MNKTFTMSALTTLGASGILVLISCCSALNGKSRNPKFRVVAFFTAKQDPVHISFVNEANLQLINATAGYHLWSERYDREMKDIFDVQDEITLAVVDALKLKLLGDEKDAVLRGHHTKDSAAYQAYLKGRALLYQRGLSIPKAIDCFQQAVSLDSEYAQAWAGLADGYT